MTPQASLLPLAAVLVPVATAAVVALAGRRGLLRDAAGLLGALGTFAVVVALLPAVRAGQVPTSTGVEILPGLRLALAADGTGMLFALLAAFLWVPTSLFAAGYMRGHHEDHLRRFFTWYALCLGTTFGLAFAADLFTFFIFYELLTVATYPLVAHGGDDQARVAGRRYLAYLLSGGAALLLATAVLYQLTGDVTFTAGGGAAGTLPPVTIAFTFALMAFGFGTKSAIMPLHAWLPSAMVAPTPVSALLHAVAVVKAGVFGFARTIGFVFGPAALIDLDAHLVLAALCGATILIASVMAVRATPLKRRLAFSTIAHLAYIVLGFALLSTSAFEGGLLHLVNHGVAKITLFMCAGTLLVHRHVDQVTELDGIGRTMPWTMGAFAVASLSLAGLPPTGGLISKWYLVTGGFDADQAALAIVMVLGGIGSASYLFPIVHRAFFRAAPPTPVHPPEVVGGVAVGGAREASWTMVVPLCLTAATTVVLGLGDLLGVGRIAATVASVVVGGAP